MLQIHAVVAQLVEHITRNDGVTGSTPVNGFDFLGAENSAVSLKRLAGHG